LAGNEKRWEIFVDEVIKEGVVWTLHKDEIYATSNNRYGTKCFPLWSSKDRVLKQIKSVPAYEGYSPIGFYWEDFLEDWISHLKQNKCLLGVNYGRKENIGFDLPIDEVVSAICEGRKQ